MEFLDFVRWVKEENSIPDVEIVAVPVQTGREACVEGIMEKRSAGDLRWGVLAQTPKTIRVIDESGRKRTYQIPAATPTPGYVFIYMSPNPVITAEVFHIVSSVPYVRRSSWIVTWASPIPIREYMKFADSLGDRNVMEIVASRESVHNMEILRSNIRRFLEIIARRNEKIREWFRKIGMEIKEKVVSVRFPYMVYSTICERFAPHFLGSPSHIPSASWLVEWMIARIDELILEEEMVMA